MIWRPLLYVALALAPFLAFGLVMAAFHNNKDQDGDQT